MNIMSNACLHAKSVLGLLNTLLLVLLYSTRIVVKSSVVLVLLVLDCGHDQNVRCLLHSDSALKFPNTCFWLATVDLHRVLLVQQLMTTHGNARALKITQDSASSFHQNGSG